MLQKPLDELAFLLCYRLVYRSWTFVVIIHGKCVANVNVNVMQWHIFITLLMCLKGV